MLTTLSFDGGPVVPVIDLRVTGLAGDPFPDTGDCTYVTVRFTAEGIVYDVIEAGSVVGTDSETWDELADRLRRPTDDDPMWRGTDQ